MSTLKEHFVDIQGAFERLETCDDGHFKGQQPAWLNIQNIEDDVREQEEYMLKHERRTA